MEQLKIKLDPNKFEEKKTLMTTIRFRPSVLERLDNVCGKLGYNRSALIEALILNVEVRK